MIDVTYWSLGTTVIRSTPQGVQIDSDLTEDVLNPLDLDLHAAIGASTADTSLHFVWSDTGGDFLIQASHRAEDYDVRSTSNGLIRFTSSADLLFAVEGSYTYDLPGGPMAVRIGVIARDAQTDDEIFAQGFNDNTFLEGHAEGTFSLQGQTLLPANREINLSYFMYVDTFDSTGLIGSGDGFVHFTLAPVPEAGTLALAILVSAIVLARHRRIRLSRLS